MRKIIFYLLLCIFAFAFLYPFLWMVSASLSEERSITNVTLWPVSFTLDHYIKLFQSIPISGAFLNSIFVATLVTFGVLVFSSMAGYALARHRFKGRNLLFYFLLLFVYLLCKTYLYSLSKFYIHHFFVVFFWILFQKRNIFF